MKLLLVTCVVLATVLQEHFSRAAVCTETKIKSRKGTSKHYRSCGWWGWSRCGYYKGTTEYYTVEEDVCCDGDFGYVESDCTGDCNYISPTTSNQCNGNVCRDYTCDRSGITASQTDLSDNYRDANNNDAWKLTVVNATCFARFTCPTRACDCEDRKKRAVAVDGEEGELLDRFDRIRRSTSSYLCSKNVPGRDCTVSNTAMFEIKNGVELWRRPCMSDCRDCANQPGCFDNSERYTTTVSCSAVGYDINDLELLSYEVVIDVLNVDPPAVAFPDADVPVTIRWTDQVGHIVATPDFEFPDRIGDVEYDFEVAISTSGTQLFAFNGTSGNVEVIAELTEEESADYNLTLCVNTRRHTVCAVLQVSFLGEPEEPYCSAIGAWADVPYMHNWCQIVCKHSSPYCPPTHCTCSDQPEPGRTICTPVHPWSSVSGMEAWCDWTCNDPVWKNRTCLNSYCECDPPVFAMDTP